MKTTTAPDGAVQLAGPFATLTSRMQPYTLEMMLFGLVLLGMCVVVVAVKGGFRSAVSKKNEGGTVTRDNLSAFGGILIAAFMLGVGSVAIAIAVEMGKAA